MHADANKSEIKFNCELIAMIVPKARKYEVSKVHSKLDYVVLNKPSPHMKRNFLKFAPITANKNIL